MTSTQPPSQCYVVGLGRSGSSIAKWLAKEGRLGGVWDDGLAPTAAMAPYWCSPEDAFSPDAIAHGRAPDALILSPGIPHGHPACHPAAILARRHHVPILCDVEVFYRHMCQPPRPDATTPALDTRPKPIIIGITGTNGKSTTTSLITHILRLANLPAWEGGNIGVPCFDLIDILENPGKDHASQRPIFVLEMSSFQLELCPTLLPDLMILLNITPNHLDRYPDFTAYAEAKAAIFDRMLSANSGVALIGTSNPTSAQVHDALHQRLIQRPIQASSNTPSSGPPRRLDATGSNDFVLWGFSSADLPPDLGEILKDSRALGGEHNRENAAAAYYVARHFGIDVATIGRGFASFPGLPHRQEWVTTKEGLSFVNDSKATNFDAAGKALSSFSHIYWLVGGQAKGDSIFQCRPYFPGINHVFFYGRDGAKLKADLGEEIPSSLYETLDEALTAAILLAKDNVHHPNAHATILLSPACASMDQFKNFEHRGDHFKRLVATLGV